MLTDNQKVKDRVIIFIWTSISALVISVFLIFIFFSFFYISKLKDHYLPFIVIMLSLYLIILTIIVPFGLKNPHDKNNKRYYDLVKWTFLSSFAFLTAGLGYMVVQIVQSGNEPGNPLVLIIVVILFFISLFILFYVIYRLLSYLFEDSWLIKQLKQFETNLKDFLKR